MLIVNIGIDRLKSYSRGIFTKIPRLLPYRMEF
jgi:hypothetical protein